MQLFSFTTGFEFGHETADATPGIDSKAITTRTGVIASEIARGRKPLRGLASDLRVPCLNRRMLMPPVRATFKRATRDC
jgi:hypothetical protein